MPRNYEICGVKQAPSGKGWITCNRKAGHNGYHADTKHAPATYWKD